MSNLISRMGWMGFLTLSIAPVLAFGGVEEKLLGDVVAVERQYTVNFEDCVGAMEESPGYDGPSFSCRVELMPFSIHDEYVRGDEMSYQNDSCAVSFMAGRNGYAIYVRAKRSRLTRDLGETCLRDAIRNAQVVAPVVRLKAIIRTLRVRQ